MWELDYKESWEPKNWCFWTVMLQKTLESPLGSQEIQEVNPKDQSWVFIEKNDVEAETSILRPPNSKNWLIGKDPDPGNDWRQEEKGMTEDEMVESLTQWTWAWVNSGSWWWTERPGMLQSIGLQGIRHNWVTELNWECYELKEQSFLFHQQVCETILKMCVSVAFSCPTPGDAMDSSPPGYTDHRILQARTLEWVAFSFSRRSSWPRDQSQVYLTASRFFTILTTRLITNLNEFLENQKLPIFL